jgi:uncharacterized RDD family membrane protein YckC
MNTFPESPDQLMPATLPRRLAAMFYDSILCIALCMTMTMIYMAISHSVIGPEEYKQLNDSGQSIRDPLLSSTLFISVFFFFGYFWTRTGQTLGMQVWHLRVQNEDNSPISWKQALIRFFVAGISIATLGAGYLWKLIDKQDRTWQCIISDSKIYRIPKRSK